MQVQEVLLSYQRKSMSKLFDIQLKDKFFCQIYKFFYIRVKAKDSERLKDEYTKLVEGLLSKINT